MYYIPIVKIMRTWVHICARIQSAGDSYINSRRVLKIQVQTECVEEMINNIGDFEIYEFCRLEGSEENIYPRRLMVATWSFVRTQEYLTSTLATGATHASRQPRQAQKSEWAQNHTNVVPGKAVSS